MEAPKRYVPERVFPPYTFVPGKTPHPINDPAGHSSGADPPKPDPFDPHHWEKSVDYLYGVDLFNYGYYWEAHEVWEGLWHVTGHDSEPGLFLKGLIKLTAAGVKALQQNDHGIRAHIAGAREIFHHFNKEFRYENYAGMKVPKLIRSTHSIDQHHGYELDEIRVVQARVFSGFLTLDERQLP